MSDERIRPLVTDDDYDIESGRTKPRTRRVYQHPLVTLIMDHLDGRLPARPGDPDYTDSGAA